MHLAILDDVCIRGDKVMSESERDEFLSHDDATAAESCDGSPDSATSGSRFSSWSPP